MPLNINFQKIDRAKFRDFGRGIQRHNLNFNRLGKA